jgi:hypothetical protein
LLETALGCFARVVLVRAVEAMPKIVSALKAPTPATKGTFEPCFIGVFSRLRLNSDNSLWR